MESTKEKKPTNIYNLIRYIGFQDRLVNSIQNCLSKSEFLDLTLICGTHKFEVQKVILSCLSPYFYELLKKQPAAKSTLVVNDISWEIMQKILIFLYSGSVKLEPNQTADFMRAAERFKIGTVAKIKTEIENKGAEIKNHDINNNTAKTQPKLDKTFDDKKRKNKKTVTFQEFKVPRIESPQTAFRRVTRSFLAENNSKTISDEDENLRKEIELICANKPKPEVRYSLRSRPVSVSVISDEKKRRSSPRKPTSMCLICNKTIEKSCIYTHMKNDHNYKEETDEHRNKTLCCFDCGESFVSGRMLTIHTYRTHK